MQRPRFHLWLVLPVIAGSLCNISAETTRSITLAECIHRALEHNLDVRISRLNPQMVRYALQGDYAAYVPSFYSSLDHTSRSLPQGVDSLGRTYPSGDFVVDSYSMGILGETTPWGMKYTLSHNDYGQTTTRGPFSDDYSEGLVKLEVTQHLLKDFWIDSARYTIALRKKNLRVSELDLQNTIMATVATVEQAYYSLIAAVEQVKVQEQALQEAEQQLRENRKRVEVGVMAPLDEKDAESQVAASRANLLASQSSLTISQNQLRSLLTDDYAEWQDVLLAPAEKLDDTPRIFSRQDSWSKGLTMRPDLLQARLKVEQQRITLVYLKNQLYPQLDLLGSYTIAGSGSEYADSLHGITKRDLPSYSFGVGLTYPIGKLGERSRYRSSKLEQEQLLLQLKRLEHKVMTDIDDAIATAKSSLEQVSARRQAAEYAMAAYEAEQKKLENGKSTSFQVLVLQRILTSRRFEEISALTDYNRALATLALREGSILERNRLVVDLD